MRTFRGVMWCVGALGLVAVSAVAGHVSAQPVEPQPPKPSEKKAQPHIATFGVAVAVAEHGGDPVRDEAWVASQVDRADELFAPFGVELELVEVRALDEQFAELEDAADRDALADHRKERVIDVFVVKSLRDVDDPTRYRMGVRWRRLSNVKQHFIIVAASARETTLAHELGHYFGNGHTSVRNNLMSYERDDEASVFVDAVQGARIRQLATSYLARQELWPIDKVRPLFADAE